MTDRPIDNDTITVVHLLSLSYTGTTYINVLLGCHERAFALGAGDVFYDAYKKGDWANACRIHKDQCGFWPRFLREYDSEKNFFVQLAEASGKTHIIVNNLLPDGMARDLNHPQVAVKPINVTRDGRAVSRSAMRHHQSRDYLRLLFDWSRNLCKFDQGDRRWASEGPARKVKYEDTVANPQAALDAIGGFIGLTYPPGAVDYWKFDHHLIGGNMSMFYLIRRHQGLTGEGVGDKEFYEKALVEEAKGRTIVDDRWKMELNRRDLFWFDYLCGKINERMGYPRDKFTKQERREWAGPTCEALKRISQKVGS